VHKQHRNPQKPRRLNRLTELAKWKGNNNAELVTTVSTFTSSTQAEICSELWEDMRVTYSDEMELCFESNIAPTAYGVCIGHIRFMMGKTFTARFNSIISKKGKKSAISFFPSAMGVSLLALHNHSS